MAATALRFTARIASTQQVISLDSDFDVKALLLNKSELARWLTTCGLYSRHFLSWKASLQISEAIFLSAKN